MEWVWPTNRNWIPLRVNYFWSGCPHRCIIRDNFDEMYKNRFRLHNIFSKWQNKSTILSLTIFAAKTFLENTSKLSIQHHIIICRNALAFTLTRVILLVIWHTVLTRHRGLNLFTSQTHTDWLWADVPKHTESNEFHVQICEVWQYFPDHPKPHRQNCWLFKYLTHLPCWHARFEHVESCWPCCGISIWNAKRWTGKNGKSMGNSRLPRYCKEIFS